MVKIIIYTLCAIAIPAGIAAFFLVHGSAVPLAGVGNLKATPIVTGDHGLKVRVTGKIIDSSPGIAITNISQRREGHLIIVVVRKGFRAARPSTGNFSADVTVSNDVDAIAFQSSRDIIWRR